MSKVCDCIDAELAAWIGQQHVFFVATAPLSEEGHVNCSPICVCARRQEPSLGVVN